MSCQDLVGENYCCSAWSVSACFPARLWMPASPELLAGGTTFLCWGQAFSRCCRDPSRTLAKNLDPSCLSPLHGRTIFVPEDFGKHLEKDIPGSAFLESRHPILAQPQGDLS